MALQPARFPDEQGVSTSMHQTIRFIAAVTLAACVLPTPGFGQSENPVYVDDSPQAWELFRQAQDQTRNNAGEAVRLYQELLDEFALKLIPIADGASDHLKAVRQRVIQNLLADETLLTRYRLIQTPQAETLLQNGDLQRLALTRSLTEPGIEALLRLAQRDLEAARFHSCKTWLLQALEHPDLMNKRAVHCYYMFAMASHFLNDAANYQWAADQLKVLGADGEQFSGQLEALKLDGASRPVEAFSTFDQSPAGDLEDLVAQAIWTVPLKDSLMSRRFQEIEMPQLRQPINPAGMDRRLQDPEFNTAAITVKDSVAYINQGHTILALNRLTGRQFWVYSDVDPISLTDGERTDPLDLNVVAVADGAVVTLTGHALPNSRSQSGKMICLDAETGSQRWMQNLSGLIEGGGDENLFPHGAPIIIDGTVYAVARKVSPQFLTSAYVVAIDLATGRPRWSRHVTSSGGLQARVRPFCTLVHHDGMLYLASAVGAAAKIEPETGEIVWLHRFNVPITPGVMDQARRPWEIITPVITRRGMIAIQPDQRRIAVLDTETGDLLETQSISTTTGWNMPRYLLADDENLYAIGSEIRAFNLDDLQTPRWRLPLAVTRQAEPGTRIEQTPLELRGRVQLTEDSLVVPTADGVLIVDHETGLPRQRLAVSPSGNPLAIDSQLLLASGDRLDAYMSLTRAEQMLRERITQAPSEPDPALSLLRLGMRVRNLSLSLEAAGLAVSAINRISAASPIDRRAADSRAQLFDLLLELADARIQNSIDEGELLYATIEETIESHEQRVEYLLSYAQWQADHALSKTIESYQSILSNPELSMTRRSEDGRSRSAAAWARERISQLIATRGPAVYAAQADFANLRLRQFMAVAPGTSPNAEQLVALALEYPFSDAAIEAAVQSAALRKKQGNVRQAIADLLAVYDAAPSQASAARLLGPLVALCIEANWNHQAAAALEHILATYGDIQLIAPDQSRLVSAWLSAIAPKQAAPHQPVIGQPAGGEKVEAQTSRPGTIVPSYQGSEGNITHTALLVRIDRQIERWAGPELKAQWKAPVDGDSPQVLLHDDTRALLWFASDPLDPKATLLDAGTGTIEWTAARLGEILGITARDGRPRVIRDQMPNGEPFDPTVTLPLVNDRSLIAVQRTGTVAAINMADGKLVQWVQRQALEKIYDAKLTDAAIVLAGMGRYVGRGQTADAAEAQSRLVVLDPLTGKSLFETQQVDGLSRHAGAKWLVISRLGLIVYGTAEGLQAIDSFSGNVRWTNTSYPLVDTQRAWMLDQHVLVEDERGRLRTVDLHDGSVSEPFEVPPRGEWDQSSLREIHWLDGQLVALYSNRVLFFNPSSGAIVGSDAIAPDDRNYRWLLPARDGERHTFFILINSRAEQVEVEGQQGMRNQHVYRIQPLSSNGKAQSDPFEVKLLLQPAQQVSLLNGWLILSTNMETIAIPMPAN
jgi:outer membrane protein assembly factor BamB